MRALLARCRPFRAAIAIAAGLAVAAAVHAASAGGDIGLRRNTLTGEYEELPVVAPRRHHGPRRIWAASGLRPLRIALHRRRHRHVAASPRRRTSVAAREPQVVFPKLAPILMPPPARPAVVSIYQDRTLQTGDAVMLADGIHVFRSAGVWPYRPRDFVKLGLVAGLDWHLRATLTDLDRNPPIRWSTNPSVSG